MVGLVGLHDQLAVRQNEAHNLWAYPEMPPNGQPVDYQAAAGVLEANGRPGDVVAYEVDDSNHYQVDTSIAYYLRRQARAPDCLPGADAGPGEQPAADRVHRPVGLHHGHAADLGGLRPPPAAGPVLRASRERGGLVETLGYQIVTQYQLNGITVALLSIGPESG